MNGKLSSVKLKAQEDEKLRQEAERLRQHQLRESELEAQGAVVLKQHKLALVLEEVKAEKVRKARNAERERREAEGNAERERREMEERQREHEYDLHLQ